MTLAFLLNLFLAVVYVMLTGNTSTPNMVIGFAIGFFVLFLYGLTRPGPSYPGKVWRLIRFGLYFLKILIQANMKIAWECITPGLSQTPRILRHDVSDLTDTQLTILATSITLTPGTLVVDVSDDHKWLYVHCMYAQDRSSAIAELRDLHERLKREVFA